jgi:hypothetical protein
MIEMKQAMHSEQPQLTGTADVERTLDLCYKQHPTVSDLVS